MAMYAVVYLFYLLLFPILLNLFCLCPLQFSPQRSGDFLGIICNCEVNIFHTAQTLSPVYAMRSEYDLHGTILDKSKQNVSSKTFLLRTKFGLCKRKTHTKKQKSNPSDIGLATHLYTYSVIMVNKDNYLNNFSTIKSILAGVPMGSVLGPLLFLVYINDIAQQLRSLTRLFADDSSYSMLKHVSQT